MLPDAQDGSTNKLLIGGLEKGERSKTYYVCDVLVREIANICQSFIAITVQNKTVNEI